AEAIERAIELNGVGVATTIQAFRAGRKTVLDPAWLAGSNPVAVPTPVSVEALSLVTNYSGELRRLLEIRVPELVSYQNLAYAKRYLAVVSSVDKAERAAGTPGTFTESVARNLFKLMAYKDEYEVARLHLDPALQAEVEAKFGEGTTIGYQLHPPVLRAMGMNRKITFKRTARPMFKTLRALRRLRGTAFDPFGRAHLRKVERELITEYVRIVEDTTARLTPANYAMAVELANTPDMIRGYEEIKLESVTRFRAQVAALRSREAVAA
ncbi:MAG: 2-oxoacid ferredoxin oxidoreductase, partial [Actinomycetota bacterium]|nr:2-oxoacid ferredoxin oxidoreductase [Actinomycetota bacterium]